MKMRAIHQIVRMGKNGLPEVIQPETDFICPAAEGEDYLKLAAATLLDAEEGETEAEPAKPAKKAAKAAKPEATTEAPASTGDSTAPAGETTAPAGDSMLD